MTVSLTSMPFPVREQAPRPIVETLNLQTSSLPSDADARRLAEGVGRGKETAFQELYDRYRGRLFRLAIVLARGDETIARDVVQSAMLTAAARLRSVDSEDHLWNWLARVLHQHLTKEWRRKERESIFVPLSEEGQLANAIENDALVEQNLNEALLMLDEDAREIIEWFYFD